MSSSTRPSTAGPTPKGRRFSATTPADWDGERGHAASSPRHSTRPIDPATLSTSTFELRDGGEPGEHRRRLCDLRAADPHRDAHSGVAAGLFDGVHGDTQRWAPVASRTSRETRCWPTPPGRSRPPAQPDAPARSGRATATPAVPNDPDPSPIEVGVKFQAERQRLRHGAAVLQGRPEHGHTRRPSVGQQRNAACGSHLHRLKRRPGGSRSR